MPELEIQPFSDAHLEVAAELLAARHQRHRESEPLLPEIDDFREHVEKAWGSDRASGAVALQDGQPVGYLIGAPREQPIWGGPGENVWIELAGHAVTEPEIARDLYAAAAARWVADGKARHYAVVPATDDHLVDAWFRLGFGTQHGLGIREVPAEAGSPSNVQVREAAVEDLEAVLPLDPLLYQHQLEAPVFAGGDPPDPERIRAAWKEELDDPSAACLLATMDGRPVGCASVADVSLSSMHDGLARPARACILGFAATLPEVRGSGAGVALTEAVFAWAREHGYATIVVDWRETNLLSSRFWPNRGFRRTFQRLYRSIP